MPIEIKELNIRVNVQSTNPHASNAGSLNPNSEENQEREKFIIAQCVEQVMEILKQKLER